MYAETRRRREFQYHIVQLKENGRAYLFAGYLRFQYHIVQLKERDGNTKNIPRKEFQYHIVQLKEKLPANQEIADLFQYHIVQLKVGFSSLICRKSTCFNTI